MAFYTTEELLHLPNQQWLIKGLLPETGLCLLFGPPGEGKSFVAIDWSLCVATGRPWLGAYATKAGHVVYIAAEGGQGIKKRVAAWMQAHEEEEITNITWYLDTLDIRAENVVEDFMTSLYARFPVEHTLDPDGECMELGLNVKLIVLDTLSRNFGGEDENTSAAMSQFIESLEDFCRVHGATVLILHHTNAMGARERGHSALKGAMEASFLCSAEKEHGMMKTITLENNKQKDDKDEDAIYITPERVELPMLPRDEDGEILTSLILTHTSESEALADVVTVITDLLDEHSSLSGLKVESLCGAQKIGRNAVRKALEYGVAQKLFRVTKEPNGMSIYRRPGSSYSSKLV
jgi:RecA-family ATPase